MAALLPRYFALKSYNNKKYLRYIHQSCEIYLHGPLQFSAVDVKSPNAKFQMVPAYGGYEGLVHIKCCYNDKYLRRANDHEHCIVAQANEPDEDLNHWSCTLFEPQVLHPDNKTVLRILHVQLGHYLMSLTCNDFRQCLVAERADPNLQNDLDVCIVFDLEKSILDNYKREQRDHIPINMAALLPRSFALKSNNRKYLSYMHQSCEIYFHGLLQFSEVDVKSPNAKFQMEPAYGGYEGLVHIKCCYNNKYLRRANDQEHWIVAQADEPEDDQNHWSCTLFEPRVLHPDNKTVLRILHVQLGHYLMSLNCNDFRQCLVAERADPNIQNDLDVCIVVDLDPLALPNTFVLKSNSCYKYLRYMLDEENQTHEIVQFSGKDPRSEYSIFQVEQANNQDDRANHYVHIKCTVNNKYFRRMDKDKQLIMAAADQRDENKKNWACTLFKPEHVGQASNNNNDNVLCRLRHVQSNLYTRPFVENRFELRLNDERPDPHGVDVYTAIRSFI